MAMGEGRGTILTLPVFGFFGSLLAPVDLEFVDGEGAGPVGGQAAVGGTRPDEPSMHLPCAATRRPCNAPPWNRDSYLMSSLILRNVGVATADRPLASHRSTSGSASPAGP